MNYESQTDITFLANLLMLISNVELETSYQFRKCNFRNVDISDIGKPNTRSKKGKISIFIFSLQIIDVQREIAAH